MKPADLGVWRGLIALSLSMWAWCSSAAEDCGSESTETPGHGGHQLSVSRYDGSGRAVSGLTPGHKTPSAVYILHVYQSTLIYPLIIYLFSYLMVSNNISRAHVCPPPPHTPPVELADKLAWKHYMHLNKHPFRLFSHGNTEITHNGKQLMRR